MAYIYKITNLINDKIYVGKTMLTIQERWKEHLNDSKKNRCKNRPLYSAINKYGAENFIIEQIEKCSDNIVNEREIYWIEKLGSYHFGYNATKGGDGTHYLDYDKIVSVYLEGNSIKDTAKICNCNVDSVVNILKERSIPIKSSTYWIQKKYSKPIQQLTSEGELLNEFFGLREAARFLQEKNFTKAVDVGGIATNIRRAAKSTKSYLGFKWKFKD